MIFALELDIMFVDFTKTFDTVNMEALWKVLKKLGIPDDMLNVIIFFHEEMKASVISDGIISDLYGHKLHQKGSIMVPVLFAPFFSVMLNHSFSDTDVGVKF